MALPIVGALIASGFGSVTGFFAAMMTKKAAVGAALAAFLIAGWIALQVALLALYTGLSYSLPSTLNQALAVVAFVMPSNFETCLSAIVLAKVGRWLWDRQREWGLAVAQA